MNNLLTVRSAVPADIDAIYDLLELYTASGVVLKRSKEDIAFYLGNFVVALFDDKICGCCAVRDFGNDLLEVRSLVVDPAMQGKGVGKAMLEAIISGLKLRRLKWRLFTLTMQPGFFRNIGFVEVSKEMFPEKIWSDCAKCAKRDKCDEIALLLESSCAK